MSRRSHDERLASRYARQLAARRTNVGTDEHLDRLEAAVKSESAADVYRRRLDELEASGVRGGQLWSDLRRALALTTRGTVENEPAAQSKSRTVDVAEQADR